MTTADEVKIWLHALKLHDNTQYNEAVNEFKKLHQSARIQFNIACCYLAADDVNNAMQVASPLLDSQLGWQESYQFRIVHATNS